MFARHRRKMGDDRIDAAWHKASFKVSIYLGFLSVACLLVLIAAIYSLTDVNFPAAHKRPWQFFAGIVGVLTGILLDRRFKRYLSPQPILAAEESSEEKSLVRWFRITTIAAFVLACIGGYLLNEVRN